VLLWLVKVEGFSNQLSFIIQCYVDMSSSLSIG